MENSIAFEAWSKLGDALRFLPVHAAKVPWSVQLPVLRASAAI